MSTVMSERVMTKLDNLEGRGSALAWLICGLGAVFYSYEYLLRISPGVMLNPLMEHYSINATMFGTMSAFYYYAYVPMQLPVGMLMDRFGPRRLLTFACGVCVISTLIYVATHSVFMGSLGRFFMGFGSAFAFVGVLKLASIWLPPNRFAFFTGLSSALGTVGAMAGVFLLTHLVQAVGWLETMYASAVFGVGLTIVLWLVMRDHSSTKENAERISEQKQGEALKQSLQEMRQILMNPQMWVVGLIGCFIYLPTTAFGELWGIPYLENARGLTSLQADYAISALFLGFTIGAPSMGLISDYAKTRKGILQKSAILATLLAGILIFTPTMSYYAICFVLFALGLSYGAQSLVFVIGRELSPASASATAIGVTNMMVMLGSLFAQPLIGKALDFLWDGTVKNNLPVYSVQNYQTAMIIIPVGMIISGLLCLVLKETYGTVKEEDAV